MPKSTRPISPRAFASTWIIALFGLLVGVTMVYVPYEFGAPIFRYVQDWKRLMGATFLAGSLLLGTASLYPEWPRFVGRVGRVLLVIAITAYWWWAGVMVDAWTGAAVYPLMVLALIIEDLPAVRRRDEGTFVYLFGLTAVALGSLMLLIPEQFPDGIYLYLQPVIGPVGGVALAAGAALIWAHWKEWRRTRTVLLLIASVPLAWLGVNLALVRSWSGAELYFSYVLGALICAFAHRLSWPASLRFNVWRGMVVAAGVPLLLLGALATVLMQRAVERQALEESRRMVAAEVQWLQQLTGLQLSTMSAHAALPSFSWAVAAKDHEAIKRSIDVLHVHASGFAGIFVAAPDGRVLARSRPKVPMRNEVGTLNWFDDGEAADRAFVSRPWRGLEGEAWIATVAPVRVDGELVGLLVGAQSLDALTASTSSTKAAVQVLDRREEVLLRDSLARDVLVPIDLPAEVIAAIESAREGSFRGADARMRQVLLTWAEVPGTDWVVLARQQVQDAYALVTQLGGGAVFLVSAAALLALLLSQITVRDVLKRVRRIREAAEGLAKGNLERRAEPGGNDELTDLATTFNDMAAQIQTAHAELERTNAELRSAVSTRDEFLSLASHELRTPLTALKLGSQTLRTALDQGGERERVDRVLGRMDRQAERLADLIGDMLDVSRIQGGKLALEPQPMELCEHVEDVLDRLRAAHAHHMHLIELERPNGPLDGEWDGGRLEQVVVNLVENAIRYSPGGGRIRVTLREHGDVVELAVADEGIGIPAENLTQLFQPFFRASNATARHYGGLGLGLHICREIVERHGGRIHAESEGVNQGSRFVVELPRRYQPPLAKLA